MYNIFIFIISFYFLLVSVLGYGNLFKKFVLNNIDFDENLDVLTGFYGLTFLTLISLITSFVFEHNFYHNTILHLIGFLYFCFNNLKKNKKYLKNIFFISIFCISILLISKTHDDFSYYHFPFTKYLTENHVIFGMGNLNLGYNFLSSLFFLNSTFYLPFIELYSFHFSSIFCLIFFNYFILIKIYSKQTHKFFLYIYLLTFVFFNVSFNRLAEYGMDKAGQLIIVLVVIKLFEIIISTKEENKLKNLLLLIPLIGLCVSIKTYFLSYILLSLSVFLINKNFIINLKNIIYSKSFLAFLIILFATFSHQFIATGCLISPLPYFCFGDTFEWGKSLADVEELSIWLEQWSKAGAGPNFRVEDRLNYIKNFNWLSHWYEKYFVIKFIDQIAILFVSFLILLFTLTKLQFSKNKINFKKEMILFYTILIIIFFIWFNNHPTLRYGGYSIFYLIVAFPISSFLFKLEHKQNSLIRINAIIIFVVLIVNTKNLLRINDEINRGDVYEYKNFPYFSLKDKEYKFKNFDSGLTVFFAHHCWNTPSPCGSGSLYETLKIKKKMGYYFIYLTR